MRVFTKIDTQFESFLQYNDNDRVLALLLNYNNLTNLCFNLKTLSITQLSPLTQISIISTNHSSLHFLLIMNQILF